MNEHQLAFPLLAAIVLTPAGGAAVVALLPRAKNELVALTGLLCSVAVGALAVILAVQFEASEAAFQFVSEHAWISDLGVSWKLGVDGISLWLVVLTAILFPIALAGGGGVDRDLKAYTAWMLLLETGCLGSFLALDLVLFFVFFELVLVPMYFLIAGWGHDNRVYASVKFFLFTLAGSGFLLVGILSLAFLARGGVGQLTFDLEDLAGADIAPATARWLFGAFAIAFAVKVPLIPFHTWLPDAHTEAPTAGSVILAGVLLKLGTYGLLRFCLYLFPAATLDLAPVMLTLAVVGMTYGAVVAAMQTDLKRLVAYSSVAHLGFIVLGTFALTSTALTGGILQMVNHGLSTGALFLLVGMIYERRHTREISQLKGLQKPAPVLAAVFTIVMLSSIGVPGLNGFVGEFLVLAGTFASRRWWAVVGTAGVVLAALYLLWAYQRVFHGTPDEANASFPDMTLRERLVMAPLVGLIVVLGVYPKFVLDRMEPSVNRLLAEVESRQYAPAPPPVRVPENAQP